MNIKNKEDVKEFLTVRIDEALKRYQRKFQAYFWHEGASVVKEALRELDLPHDITLDWFSKHLEVTILFTHDKNKKGRIIDKT